jgi:GDPmannose 4,6-dehydratase
MKKAVITGVAGQDGSYLAELLLENGYNVVGLSRRKSVESGIINIKHLFDDKNFIFVEGDVTDPTFVFKTAKRECPDEWYNLAAQSNVGHSFEEPVLAFDINAKSVIIQLEALRQFSPKTKFYQASTSELWGGLKCPEGGYDESMKFHPRSPYGVSKLAAYWATVNYREAYGMFACNGILHNHSSPRRGFDFATRKITHGVASVKLGLQDKVRMGNLASFRDEGHSSDYVRAMYLMLQQDIPKDYLVATGDGATMEEMFRYVCELAELNFEDVYEVDERFMRPSEVPYLRGNPKVVMEELDWRPKYTWKKLLKEMYENDLKNLSWEGAIVI